MTRAFAHHTLGGNEQWSIISADPAGTTVRRIRDGDASRLVVRTRFTNNPSMKVSQKDVTDAAQLCRKKNMMRVYPTVTPSTWNMNGQDISV